VLVQSTIRQRVRVSDDARFLTVNQVRERYGAADSWVARRTLDANFRKPVRFGPGVSAVRRWRRADIEAWEAERASCASTSAPRERVAS
jgi:predicted DNA-binding transcriptional regulator AlpA